MLYSSEMAIQARKPDPPMGVKTIIVPLRHIFLEPGKSLALERLPAEEAVRFIKESYGFLSTAVEVRIEDGVAMISLPGEKAARIQDGLKLYEKGIKAAQSADYARAISQFQRALQIMPLHVDARRNLAMAHLERGNPDTAKNLLR